MWKIGMNIFHFNRWPTGICAASVTQTAATFFIFVPETMHQVQRFKVQNGAVFI